MEDLGLHEDVISGNIKHEHGEGSPESKRRRMASDSDSSHTDEPETFGSPEPPIPMPIADVKKEEETTGGIMMPTAPKEEAGEGACSSTEKPGSNSDGQGDEGGSHREADKGADREREEATKDEKTKEQLAKEDRQKMQVLVSSFSEEQLNRYEMYRRASFPKAAIKRTVASDANTDQQRAAPTNPQPIMTPPVVPQVDAHAAIAQPAQLQTVLDQQSLLQQAVNQQNNTPPTGVAANPNAALLQALSALQPLLLQSGAQPPLGLPTNQMFQPPPTIPLLPMQPFLPGLTSPYQPSPSTTVFVLHQPLAAQAQPVAETPSSTSQHKHKNCCPGCIAEIQELRRLVDLIIRANANTVTADTFGSNIPPVLLQQQAGSHLTNQSVAGHAAANQRSVPNPVFMSSPSFSGQLQTPAPSHEMVKPPSLTPKAVQQRTSLFPEHHAGWHHPGKETAEEVDEKPALTCSAIMKQEDITGPSTSRHSFKYDPGWKAKRGKNTMDMIKNRLEPDPLNPSQYIMKDEVLAMLRQKSDDRQFIARRLANLLFTKQERKISNCHGRRHKRPLDPVRLDAIKRAVFKINPTTPDNMELAWKQCCASIDMSSRSACRNIKQP